MNVEVTPLPVSGPQGLRAGHRAAHRGVTHRDGRTDLIVSKLDDPDACMASIPLDSDEASVLANLLGAPQLVAQLREEHRDLPGISTRQLPIGENSPWDGRTLAKPRCGPAPGLRRRGDAAGQVAPSPNPDFTFTEGDLLVAVGTQEGLDHAAKILAHG
ncbi:potassium transporter TrkA [Rhodococcus hoagii]|nr:potassium transporter TrkA [Prescottella equi]